MKKDMQGTGHPVIRDMAVCHLCTSVNEGALVSLIKELIRFESEAPPGEDSRMSFHVDDIIRIIPNHCCAVTNLCDEIYGMRGDVFERMIPIEARGKIV